MLKSIKKSVKYFLILVGIVLLVPTFFYLLIRTSEVQTFIIKRITSHFSDQIKSTISVGRMEYAFFNKLTLTDLLIKDRNSDTLLYVKKLTTGLRRIDIRNRIIKLGQLELSDPSVGLITDSTGQMNLTWYLKMLSGPADTTKGKSTGVSIARISVDSGKFKILNKRLPASGKPIDFNNLHLSGISCRIDNFETGNDSTSFNVNNLSFRESGGFLLRSFTGDVTIAGHGFLFDKVVINCDSSVINADHIRLRGDSASSFGRFTEEVRLDILLRKSLISSRDLYYFIPSIKDLDEAAWISGKISGTVSELKGRNIMVSFRNRSNLDCDFDFSGLPRIEDTFIHIGVNDLNTNVKDIENIVLPGSGKIVLPDILKKTGSISFNGSFTGFTSDFVAYGTLGTDLGSLHTDVSLRPVEKNRFRIKGLLSGKSLDLGAITDRKDLLGKLTMEANVDGYVASNRKIEGNLTGNIDSVDFRDYLYKNISLNGIFTEKTWDGSIKISDKNIKMDLLGMFDFRNELPEFDFTLNLANSNLYRLNLEKSDTSSRLSMLLTANFRGNNIDNLFGEIKMLNSTVVRHNNKLDLYDFSLKAFNENNRPAISLRTDFIDADLRGYYNFGSVGNVLKSALSTLAPSEFAPPGEVKTQIKNNFRFSLTLKKTDKLSQFFKTGINISPNTTIKGIFSPDSLIKIDARSDQVNIKNNVFNNLTASAVYSGKQFDVRLNSASLSVLGQSELKDLRVDFNSKPDNFDLDVNWDNKDKILNKGTFKANAELTKNPESRRAILNVGIDSSDIYTRGNLWTISKSAVSVDSTTIAIKGFMIRNGQNLYSIDGTVSENPADTLHVRFMGIDISPIGRVAEKPNKAGVTQIPYNLKGIVNGNIYLSNVFRNPLVQSNMTISGFSILGGEYGDISSVSAWNSESKVVDINVSSNLRGARNLDVRGTYNPVSKKVYLDILTSKLPVDALNPLLSVFASGIKGTVTGKVNLSGELSNLVMKGSVMAENTSMKIDYLQTRYKINDSIYFDRTGIRFRNLKITDEKGNAGTLSGVIGHTSFRDYTADLTIEMNKSPLLGLNTQAKDNQMFYGTAYATGVAAIKSNPSTLSFDISAKVGKGTRFFIPLNTSLSATEHPFVSFIRPDTLKKDGTSVTELTRVQPTSSKLELNFDLDVTPDAEVQLLIDPKSGDVIRGKGEGKLNISLNKKGEFRIYGDYIISEGDYLFTLKNIFNKRFDVENGGKITFNGDMSNAEIDLKASYKNLKTSLYPILQDERYNERITVEPQLNLSGNLFKPMVNFDIYLPNADEGTRTYLQNAISSPDELSRQFLYLLVMNSFYADPNGPPSSVSGASGTSAMASTTTEMLSNQLSNWLSQISKDFDVGFVYRPGNNEINSQEVQVALSTQLLNDRISINGNFDVRGANNVSGEPITGDFDLEYKITDKIRFKVFNRYNNLYTGRQAPYTQGLGVFYKEDFNKLSDLLKKKEKSPMKKEDEIKPEQK